MTTPAGIWNTAVSGALCLLGPFLLTLACGANPATSAGAAASGDGGRAFYVELSEQGRWSLEAQGDYHCRFDRRNLYCMYHLWTTAASGDHATLTTTVTIPRDWEPPFGLEFYCSDDYAVQPSDFRSEGWLAIHAYPGHRFKQVLVNGEVVWEADVGDAVREQTYGVDLTDRVRPGVAFQLGLRVVDQVGTEVKLEGEWFYPGDFKPKEDPRAFTTHVYWGDLLLTERLDGDRLRPSRESPSLAKLRERIASGLVPRGPAVTAKPPATLTLEAPRGVAPGYPLSCGVPLPQGAVQHGYELRLRDARGTNLAPQVGELSRWRDGSLRWALVTLPLPADARPGERWAVSWEQSAERPAVAVRATRVGDDLIAENGLISIGVPAAGPYAVSEVRSVEGQRLAGALSAYVDVEGDAGKTRYEARWERRSIVNEGARQVTVEVQGTLTGSDDALGRCVFRFSLTEGSPAVRVWYRIFNDTERHLKITELALTQEVPPGLTRGRLATIEEPAGWLAVEGESSSVFAAVRWAAEMPTKSMGLEGDRLAIRLFKSTEEAPYFRPRSGEARRHELVLAYYARVPEDEELAALAGCCQRPPRLWERSYACETGALGYGYIHDDREFAGLSANRLNAYGDLERDRVGHNIYDMRHFGDRRYGTDKWCNNYYDASRGFLAEYLMTGNANAWDRAEEEVLHQIDVDACHWSPDLDMVGGLWSYAGDDHSNSGYVWAALLRCAGGWDYYYRMTGDKDARRALRDLAEYLLRDGHHTGLVSVRDHGGALTALVWAYDEFGDERYLRAALETAAEVRTRIARRRGAYVEVHGNAAYWVMVPWMACEATDALYRLWQLTGNEDAAVTALGIVEAMMTENATWGVPGEMGGYSGNPWFNLTSNYNIIIAPVFGYAYEMTGDPEFLLWARACFERTLEDNSVDAITNNYWLAPSLLYMLNRYREAPATMPEAPAVRVSPNAPPQP